MASEDEDKAAFVVWCAATVFIAAKLQERTLLTDGQVVTKASSIADRIVAQARRRFPKPQPPDPDPE